MTGGDGDRRSHADPIDELVRRAAGEPPPGDRNRVERLFADAVAARGGDHRRTTPLWVAVAAVALVGVAVTALRPAPAEAVLTEIARAAEKTEPLAVPPGRYAYTRSESLALGVMSADLLPHRETPLAYLLPTEREVWTSADGTVHMSTTTGRPRFFRPGDEADYDAAGQGAADGVGRTVAETFTGVVGILEEREWPTDPDRLAATISELIPPGYERPRDVEMLDIALDLLRETGAPARLRAAVVEVVARLDVSVVEQTTAGTTFVVRYDRPGETTMTFTLSPEGFLLSETLVDEDGDETLGIPPGTVVGSSTYEPTRITDGW